MNPLNRPVFFGDLYMRENKEGEGGPKTLPVTVPKLFGGGRGSLL